MLIENINLRKSTFSVIPPRKKDEIRIVLPMTVPLHNISLQRRYYLVLYCHYT